MGKLEVSISQFSSQGRKSVNQDFHDICVPKEPQLSYKGIAAAIADGIGSSDVSQEASKVAVTSFLMDYVSTPESWSVKKSALRVINAANSWLYSQTMQSKYYYDKNRGFVCTFSAMVIRSNSAYIFHIGDTRIYRLREGMMEPLTQDHKLWISKDKNYLSRALGMDRDARVDYTTHQVQLGDVYIFMSDGAYEFVDDSFIIESIKEGDFSQAAQKIASRAFDNDSDDNITVQLLRIDSLPKKELKEVYKQLEEKPFAPALSPRDVIDGYTIIREISSNARSYVYLAKDNETHNFVALKVPSTELKQDKLYMERFLMEEWIAARLNNAHILKVYMPSRTRNFLYNVMEYIEGQTLSQWMIDNPKADLEVGRSMVEQIAKALSVMHRQEMIHQDLRPQNIMIDKNQTLKIIDFGSTKVEGINDAYIDDILGTAIYSAPEYFLSKPASARSDIFSLGVIVYEMLSGGNFPYGTKIARSSKKEIYKLKYTPLRHYNQNIPIWVDGAIKKALSIDASKRYDDVWEFVYDLRHPNSEFMKEKSPAFVEKSSVTFWKSVSFVLSVVILFLLFYKN